MAVPTHAAEDHSPDAAPSGADMRAQPNPGTSARQTDLRARAWWIAGTYAGVAILWIVFSDRALGLVIRDPDVLVRLSVVKGLGFVVLTAALLLHVLRRTFDEIADKVGDLRAHEAEIERIGRLYAAQTAINQAIVRTNTPDALLQESCRALVERGGFAMAWVGWLDAERAVLAPVAVYGDDDGYLDEVSVHTDDGPDGLGPTGVALRDDVPYICNDTRTDPLMRPWRSAVERHSFRSCADFPVRRDDVTCGMLNVYAREPEFFQADEIALLTDAAADISVALDHLARTTERDEARAIAQRETSFSDAIIDSMPGILYFYDEDGRFLRWNRNFEQVSGYTGEEIAVMHPLDFFAEGQREMLAERIATVFEDGTTDVEAAFLAKDGTTTPHVFTGHRVDIGDTSGLVGIGMDISQRKHAETALRQLNETLEQRVVERTDELQTALVRAEAADRIKSAFLATMSHELRTPLNSIIGFTGIVLQGLAGPLTDEQATQLGMVRTSARHLLALINDVLDISKIEAGQLQVRCEPFDLAAAVEQATDTIRPAVEAKGLTMTTMVPPDIGEIVGDRRRVEQILLNLLSNAVKFTDTGGVTLIVQAPTDQQPANGEPVIRLRVCDTGIGISPGDMAKLFQPFRQLDSGLTRQHEGTGLGLAICRRLAGLMGGEVIATSEPSVGSEFTLTLPLDDLRSSPLIIEPTA